MNQNATASTADAAPQAPRTLGGKSRWMALFLFLFCIVAIEFSFWGEFRLGFPLSVGLFIGFCLVYAIQTAARLRPFPLLCAGFALALSAVFAFRYDPELFPILILIIITLLAIFLCETFRNNRFASGSIFLLLDILRTTVFLPLRYIPQTMQALFTGGRRSKKANQILIGMFAAIPILGIVIPLLRSSDIAFASLLQSLGERLGHLLLLFFLAVLLFPLLASLLFSLGNGQDRAAHPPKEDIKRLQRVGSVIANAFLATLSFVYLFFLFSQLAYFFSAFSGMLPADYTYSTADYARRGFFEMCAVAALNLMVIVLVLLCSKRSNGRIALSTRLLALFISGFTLLLIATAQSKMLLYINLLGMTRRRLLTSVFMVILFVAFLLLIVYLFARKFPYMRILICAGCAVLLTASYADIDRTIARYNIRAYERGALAELDVSAFSQLSVARVPYLIQLSTSSDPEIRTQSLQLLAEDTARLDLIVSDYDVIWTAPALRTDLEKPRFYAYNYTWHTAQQSLQIYLADKDCPLLECWCANCGYFVFEPQEHLCGQYPD